MKRKKTHWMVAEPDNKKRKQRAQVKSLHFNLLMTYPHLYSCLVPKY